METKTCQECKETKLLKDFPVTGRKRENGKKERKRICSACYKPKRRLLYQKWLERGKSGTRRSLVPVERTIASISLEHIEKSIYTWRQNAKTHQTGT
jgi:hypothetical protein